MSLYQLRKLLASPMSISSAMAPSGTGSVSPVRKSATSGATGSCSPYSSTNPETISSMVEPR